MWMQLGKASETRLELGDAQTGDDVYLGCSHEKKMLKIDGRGYNIMQYNVESNINKIIKNYEALLQKHTGNKIKIPPCSRCSTPYGPQENEVKSPQRGNIAGNNPTICCTWCRTRIWLGYLRKGTKSVVTNQKIGPAHVGPVISLPGRIVTSVNCRVVVGKKFLVVTWNCSPRLKLLKY